MTYFVHPRCEIFNHFQSALAGDGVAGCVGKLELLLVVMFDEAEDSIHYGQHSPIHWSSYLLNLGHYLRDWLHQSC